MPPLSPVLTVKMISRDRLKAVLEGLDHLLLEPERLSKDIQKAGLPLPKHFEVDVKALQTRVRITRLNFPSCFQDGRDEDMGPRLEVVRGIVRDVAAIMSVAQGVRETLGKYLGKREEGRGGPCNGTQGAAGAPASPFHHGM